MPPESYLGKRKSQNPNPKFQKKTGIQERERGARVSRQLTQSSVVARSGKLIGVRFVESGESVPVVGHFARETSEPFAAIGRHSGRTTVV
jgi:hypothetical protein